MIRNAAKFAMHNRKEIMAAAKCGCYHCTAIFTPAEIKEWTDDDDTAVCPSCHVDAILPDNIFPEQINAEMLNKLKAYWF